MLLWNWQLESVCEQFSVLQMQRLRARHGGVDWRRPEQSGSKRVLHSHTEQAPPPPVPALGGSSSERSRSAQGSRTDELCDEAERLVVPSSAGLAREHAQPLRSSPKELGVGSALAAFGQTRATHLFEAVNAVPVQPGLQPTAGFRQRVRLAPGGG